MQKELLKNGVKGFLVSIGTSVLLIFLFGYICYLQEDPRGLFAALGLTALYVSAVVGGISAALFNKSNGLTVGAISGLLFMLFVVIVSFFLRPANETIGVLGWVLYIAILAVSVVGGLLIKKPSKRRKKRSKRR